MKNIVILLSITLIFASAGLSSAQTPTPRSASPTSEEKTEALSEQINDLKEKIASRVAQLDLVEKRGVAGQATDIEDTQITITDIYGDTRLIDVDEITEFSSEDDASFGISDIEQDMSISVLGLYNKQSGRILARFIETLTPPVFISGKVTSVNEDDFQIAIESQSSETYTIDIETSTATREYNGEDFVRSGFSQLEVGQTVFITGFADEEDNTTIAAERLLIFSPEGDEDITPSPTD